MESSLKMNILVTLNKNYLKQLAVLLVSINKSNPDAHLMIYIISKDLTLGDIEYLKKTVSCELVRYELVKFDDTLLEGSPTTSRYPLEIYYRIFAAKVLPKEVERILYLDPDIVVINKLDELYNTNIDDNYFVGATHIRYFLTLFNRIRVNQRRNVPYINTGVMLMNIKKLREEQVIEDVYNFIDKYKNVLALPDQDVIFKLYGDKIKLVDDVIYNLSDKMLKKRRRFRGAKANQDWVNKNVVCIHYCGRNKPWRTNYRGTLGKFYHEYANELK